MMDSAAVGKSVVASRQRDSILSRMALASMLIVTVFSGSTTPAAAWLPLSLSVPSQHLKKKLSSKLFVSRSPNERGGGSVDDDEDDDEDDEDLLSNREGEETDYMSVVRKLQDSYYKSASPRPPCRFAFLDEDDVSRTSDQGDGSNSVVDTPDVLNLPILTWPWHEVPGRSNVLHVHEGTYTHMLETILRSNPPVWYFGHVYRHGKERQLQTWNDISLLQDLQDEHDEEAGKEDYNDMDLKRSNNVVMGTLCRITDYRRMQDGRLLVLTQAVERFVVKEVTQRVPFSVAHVQLVPDTEEEQVIAKMAPSSTDSRLAAILESFQKWHRYEFEQTMLPLPFSSKEESCGENSDKEKSQAGTGEYLEAGQIVGSALAQVLPYSPFSSVVNVDRLSNEKLWVEDEELLRQGEDAVQVEDLNQHLLKRGILRGPPYVEPSLLNKSCDELEHELWIFMDKFLKQSKRAVSPILLGLLPPDQQWPKNFALERIVNAIQEQHTLDHKCVRVSPSYPAHRRQKRLSYAAAAVLEDDEYQAQTWRLTILQIPSTKLRMALVVQCLMDKTVGAFQ